MTDITFGTYLPRWSSLARPEAFRQVATTAERSGYDWVGRGDHVVFPVSDEGWSWDTSAYDVFDVLSHVAAVTDEIRLGTKIAVVPYRHPVHLAKEALTVDNLSDGRFDLGVAPGWLEPEFDVLDVPFTERGSRTDEFLDLFEQVREEGRVGFDGQHHSFAETGFFPRPVGDIPVWVGGESSPAFRRIGQYGEGWMKTESVEGIREGRRRIRRAWDDFDRDGDPQIAAGQQAYVGADPPDDVDGPLVGPADEVIEGVEAYADAGATRVDVKFGPTTDSLDERLAQLERFADEVIPAFA